MIDPQSGSGSIAGAFTVVSNPPPVVTGLSPASITTSGATVTVAGANFDATSSVLLGNQVTGGGEFCTLAVSSRTGTTGIAAAVPASIPAASCHVEDAAGNRSPATGGASLSIGQYLIRVQHATDVASGDFAALVVTSTSFNPTDSGVAASKLNVKRGQAGTVIAFDDDGNPFLYVAGGSTNGADALDTVEVAPVGLFGDLGGECAGSACKFHLLDRADGSNGKLPGARAGLALVQRSVGTGSYLYAIGGRTATPTVLATVLRAQVLRNADAPTMRQITVATGAGPGAGIWYYKVAALGLSAEAPETLPSDEESVSLAAGQQPAVKWGCTAGATSYRVYRTPTSDPADAISAKEVALADVGAACSGPGAGTMTFADDGSHTADPTTVPIPHGGLGKWVDTGKTITGRFDLQAKTLPVATLDIAAVGGCVTPSGIACGSAANSSTTTVELIPFGAATDLDPASVSGTGALGTGRDRFGMGIATAGTANVSAGKSFLLVFGGETNGTEIAGSDTVQGADIATLSFSNVTGAPQNIGVGGWGDVISNQAFSEATRIALSLILPAAALAQTTRPAAPPAKTQVAAPPEKPEKGRFMIAPKLGLFEPTSKLSGAFFAGLEVGYVTPALDDHLAVVLELDWVRPKASGAIADPRLGSADASYALGNSEFGVLLSAVYRLEDVVAGLTPYGGLGPGLYFQRTAVNAFGNQYIETEGRVGFQMLAGADYTLGPGAAFVEFRYHFSRVDFISTGNTNVGGFLALGAGYRLRF